MGQRHQIYFILPKEITYKDFDGNEITSNVFGLHHQWLFGFKAGMLAKQFLDFAEIELASRYSQLSLKYDDGEVPDMLQMLYSILPSDGYYHRVSVLSKYEIQNPLRGDNNDGITVFDLRGKTPKYCLMYLYDGEVLKEKVPVHAHEYAMEYYGPHALDGRELLHEEQKALSTLSMDVSQRYELLTVEELTEVFPLMFE